MVGIIKALNFGALPTAIIVFLFGACVFFVKRFGSELLAKMDGMKSTIEDIKVDLAKNNALTKVCAETERMLVLEKLRQFVAKEKRSPDKDAYFMAMYRRFEDLGNGDDGGLLAKWNAKPLAERGLNDD